MIPRPMQSGAKNGACNPKVVVVFPPYTPHPTPYTPPQRGLVICKHGQTKPGLVTVTLERDECIVVIKKVPAEVCDNCGEYYLNNSITEQVLQRADVAVNNGAEVEIIRYAA